MDNDRRNRLSNLRGLMKILACAACLALVAGVAPRSAHALFNWPTGYVCDVQFDPNPSLYGSYGYVSFKVNTLASCTGTTRTTAVVCSTNATDPLCYEKSWRYSEAQLMGIYEALTKAAIGDMAVGVLVSDSGYLTQMWRFTLK